MIPRFAILLLVANSSWHACRSDDTIKWHSLESKRIGFPTVFHAATESWRANGIHVELSSDESELRVRRDGDVLARQKLDNGFWGAVIATDDGRDIFALSNVGEKSSFQPSTLYHVEFNDEGGSFFPVPFIGSFSRNIGKVELNDLMLSPATKHLVLVLLVTRVQSGEWTHSVRLPAFLDVRTGSLHDVKVPHADSVPANRIKASGAD